MSFACFRPLSFTDSRGKISTFVKIDEWQARNDEARASDQKVLDDRLQELESNQNRLVEALSKFVPRMHLKWSGLHSFMLDVHQSDMMAMMVSLQRRLDDYTLDGGKERNFYSHSLQYLSTTSGRQIEIQDWMVTSYEVDFGYEIGSGGL